MRKGFSSWKHATDACKVATSRMLAAVGALQNGTSRKAFSSWRDAALASKQARTALLWAASRMHSAEVAKCYSTWVSAVRAMRGVRAAAASIRHGGMRKAYNAWHEAAVAMAS